MSPQSDELEHLRSQCDSFGGQLLRMQQQLLTSRREARRLGVMARLMGEVHRLNDADVGPDDAAMRFLRVVLDRLQLDAGAILIDDPIGSRVLAMTGPGAESLIEAADAADSDDAACDDAEPPSAGGFGPLQRVEARCSRYRLVAGLVASRRPVTRDTAPSDDREVLETVLELFVQLMQLKDAMAKLTASEVRHRNIVDCITEAILIIDAPSGRILEANATAERIFGRKRDQLLQLDIQDLKPGYPLDEPASLRMVLRRVEAGVTQSFEWHRTRGDRDLWLEVRLSAARIEDRQRLLMVAADVSRQRVGVGQAHQEGLYDNLTGLASRALIIDRLDQALARSVRDPSTSFALLIMDLDRFKRINDSLGYRVGNQVLTAVARRLQATLRPGDEIGRLGGDEFVVLLPPPTDGEQALRVAERIQQALGEPLWIDDVELHATASIGVALHGDGPPRAEDVLRNAELAMYEAKASGAGRTHRFRPSMHRHALERLRLENDLRRAINEGELRLAFQPLIELAGNRIEGFEALVRWQHPTQGLIPPVRFIPLAEESRLIIPLGAWVLEHACLQMAEWRAGFPHAALRISVNLSRHQLDQPDLVERIGDILARTGCRDDDLCLEITESAVMDAPARAGQMLASLRTLGIRLSMDDFGTGYSSLSFLHQFPLDTLKVDRSFVQRMHREQSGRQIVETIITLGHSLGMQVVAEGIELDETAELLRQLNCDTGQGFLFAAPMPADEATALLAGGPPLPVHHPATSPPESDSASPEPLSEP